MTDNWNNKRVVVMGLGRFGGGLGVTRWLCRQGAGVTVTDLADAEGLTESVAQLADLDVTIHLGGHDPADLDDCELLVVNPAVPDRAPFLAEARRRGVPITTEINLFLTRCPARLVGITGSVGKSTVAAMTAAILATKFVTHLGGNIGRSLLADLANDTIAPTDVVVLELSSFQLERIAETGVAPHVSLVTNLLPNHLDWHGTMEAYANAKKNIFRFQEDDGLLIVNADDPEVATWADEAPGVTDAFSDNAAPFELAVPGPHNQLNAQAAWAIGRAMGVERGAAAAALRTFKGLPNRLALVAERAGVRYFDDSKATTPTGAIVALNSFPAGQIVAIVGGYDKGVSLAELCEVLARRCKTIVTTGQVGPQIAAGVRVIPSAVSGPGIVETETFDDAVAAAMAAASAGDAVLLSPACASYGQFNNYIQRGQRFIDLIANDSPCEPSR